MKKNKTKSFLSGAALALVEELTRYVIDLQNQIDELKKRKEWGMRKLLFIIILLFGIVWSSVAQQNTATIFRHGSHLRYEGFSNNIDKQELSQILDENAFSQYTLARREHIAAIPLWGLSGAGLVISSTFLAFGLDAALTFVPDPDFLVNNPAPIFYTVAGVFLGATMVTFIPALVLTIDSHHKLNRIANGYNQHKVSLTPTVSQSGIGIAFNF